MRKIWSNPQTRKTLLEKLDEAGFGKEELTTLQKLINAEKSDLFDVLEYVFNSNFKTITREESVTRAKATIFALLNDKQKEFIDFDLNKYVEAGISELDQEKITNFIANKIPILRRCNKSSRRCSKYKLVVYRLSKTFIRKNCVKKNNRTDIHLPFTQANTCLKIVKEYVFATQKSK